MTELTEIEEAFFREGDRMSLEADGVVEAVVIDLSSRALAPVDADYYASIAVTMDPEMIFGFFEAAA
jgi:imidazoleglycerol phosphate dehydratase HisB